MINKERLLVTFLELVQIDSPSGEERAIGDRIVSKLSSMGIAARIDANGNLLATIPGVGEPLMLNAHLDSVMPCWGIKPQVIDGVVRSDGTTVLGADDKAGVAVILEVLATVLEGKTPICPIDLVLSVREEVGLMGAKDLDLSQIRARQGLILDHGGPIENVVVGAPSQNNIGVTVHGKAAHAGVNPEAGINAILIAADAITRFPIGRLDEETTSNVGVIQGGVARNIVPETATVILEARSHDEAKLEAQTARIKAAFEESAAKFGGAVDVEVERMFGSFHISSDAPLFRRLAMAATAMGLELKPEVTGGGSDANVFNQKGIQCLIVSVGYEDVHTTKEWVPVDLMNKSAELVVRAITQS